MAFHITVHRRVDDEFFNSPPPVSSPQFDLWQEACNAKTLYENPFGSDGDVFNWWHVPALQLQLSMLSRIYDHGLFLGSSKFAELRVELKRMDEYWTKQLDRGPDFDGEFALGTGNSATLSPARVADHRERLGCFLEAIEIAEKHDGMICVN